MLGYTFYNIHIIHFQKTINYFLWVAFIPSPKGDGFSAPTKIKKQLQKELENKGQSVELSLGSNGYDFVRDFFDKSWLCSVNADFFITRIR